jgi:flagellar motor switch protein FliN/FliY
MTEMTAPAGIPADSPMDFSSSVPPVPPQRSEEAAQVITPALPDLGPAPANRGSAARDVSLLADIPVQVAVEIGRLKLPLRDLLNLEPGAILELDRPADAPVDVLVNGRLVARGEVVVIDGEFGVRVTDIVDGNGSQA